MWVLKIKTYCYAKAERDLPVFTQGEFTTKYESLKEAMWMIDEFQKHSANTVEFTLTYEKEEKTDEFV